MADSPFVHVTRVALDDIIKKHAQESKFGYFFSDEQFDSLLDELVSFLAMSRELKSAGDRITQQQNEKPLKKPGTKVSPSLSR
ncbi:MAG: hypothetical protein KA436_10830 [Oligoflexales bacterium]|nr:hypothetical protein [Oligoflexales bacterium]